MKIATAAIVFGVISATPIIRAADELGAREDQLKAAYLYNFLKFVEWPASMAGEELTVCFVGRDQVRDALTSSIEHKQIGTRQISLRRLRPSETASDCHALYLDAAMAVDIRRLQLGAHPTLTVSDAKDFAHSGGMIELFTDNNRLRFSVNIDTAQTAGIHLSSNLLKLAASVEK